MEKLFDEKGNFTEAGHKLLSDFNYGLFMIMLSDHVADMSEAELRLLGSQLHQIVGETITNKISRKLQITSYFNFMSDMEFEAYLKEKYGPIWDVTPLTPEELARVPGLTDQRIKEAMEEGIRQRQIFENDLSNLKD